MVHKAPSESAAAKVPVGKARAFSFGIERSTPPAFPPALSPPGTGAQASGAVPGPGGRLPPSEPGRIGPGPTPGLPGMGPPDEPRGRTGEFPGRGPLLRGPAELGPPGPGVGPLAPLSPPTPGPLPGLPKGPDES